MSPEGIAYLRFVRRGGRRLRLLPREVIGLFHRGRLFRRGGLLCLRRFRQRRGGQQTDHHQQRQQKTAYSLGDSHGKILLFPAALSTPTAQSFLYLNRQCLYLLSITVSNMRGKVQQICCKIASFCKKYGSRIPQTRLPMQRSSYPGTAFPATKPVHQAICRLKPPV